MTQAQASGRRRDATGRRSRSGRSGRSGRILGLDAARAIAVVGMIAANVGPRDGEGIAATIYRLPYGRASLLFVLLAGVGLSILTRSARRPRGTVPWGTVLWRAGLLLVAGLALQLLDHDVSVILPTYAILFLVALPLVRAPDRLVGGAAVVMWLAGPLAWILHQRARGADYDLEPATLLDPPGEALHAVVLSGPYPVLTWAAPFLLGMWLGRQDLRDRAVQLRLVVAGTAAAVAGPVVSRLLVSFLGEPGRVVELDRLVTAVAHSQMPLWLLSGTGSAAVVLGVFLAGERVVGRHLGWLVATGQLALTIYVAHLVVLALVRPGPDTIAAGYLVTAAITAGAVAFAVLWRRRFGTGPLEVVLRGRRRR